MDTEYPWLMLGDCLERMKEIPDGSVDMILCDLPYGTTACKWDVVIPFELLWEQYWRVIRKNGAVILFGTEPFSSFLPEKRRKAPGFIHGDIRRHCEPSEKRGEQSINERLVISEIRYIVSRLK